MHYRKFGKTDMNVSSLGFGAWAIGGNSYGKVSREDSLAALHRAGDLGCNFIDTAAVYGESENIIGSFLKGRRENWYISTKFSGQAEGMSSLVEKQLQALQTDYIDFYQIHWAPDSSALNLYDELATLKKQGKIRYAGVSLYNENDIDFILQQPVIDGFQVKLSLLDPMPFISRSSQIKSSGLGVIVRSSLKEGFLTGKFDNNTNFADNIDQRSQWSPTKISRTLKQVQPMRFLENQHRSLLQAALAYPLQFQEVSTVVVGTKNEHQAIANFQENNLQTINKSELEYIELMQRKMGLLYNPDGLSGKASSLLAALKRKTY